MIVRTAPTLHCEMVAILRSVQNAWMTAEDVANHVNRRGKFKRTRRATTPEVKKRQILARARHEKYRHMFELDDGRVRLLAP